MPIAPSLLAQLSQGANVHAEVAQLLHKLPAMFSEIVALLPSLELAMSYYQQFLQFTNLR